MGVFKIKIGIIALFAALFASPAMATTYWLDNSVAASGDGTTKETAFKSWNEAWAALGALGNTAKAELNVVASATPYYVTNATPAALKGVTASPRCAASTPTARMLLAPPPLWWTAIISTKSLRWETGLAL